MTTTIRLLAIAIAVVHGGRVEAQEPVDRAKRVELMQLVSGEF